LMMGNSDQFEGVLVGNLMAALVETRRARRPGNHAAFTHGVK